MEPCQQKAQEVLTLKSRWRADLNPGHLNCVPPAFSEPRQSMRRNGFHAHG
jgi:hypothetical protein